MACAYSALYEECTFMFCGQRKEKLMLSSQPENKRNAKSEFTQT